MRKGKIDWGHEKKAIMIRAAPMAAKKTKSLVKQEKKKKGLAKNGEKDVHKPVDLWKERDVHFSLSLLRGGGRGEEREKKKTHEIRKKTGLL